MMWAALWSVSPAHAEARNEIQADLGLTVIGLGYERVVEPHFALGVAAESFGTWFGPMFKKPNFFGLGGGLRATWFPAGEAPTGLYVAPYLRVVQASVSSDSGDRGSHLGETAGVFVGYAWTFADAWDLRLGVGGQYLNLAAEAGGEEIAFQSFWPALDLVVGRRF